MLALIGQRDTVDPVGLSGGQAVVVRAVGVRFKQLALAVRAAQDVRVRVEGKIVLRAVRLTSWGWVETGKRRGSSQGKSPAATTGDSADRRGIGSGKRRHPDVWAPHEQVGRSCNACGPMPRELYPLAQLKAEAVGA